jgi:hypothetical protein
LSGVEPHGDNGEAPIHYKWAYVDGHLTRWRRRDLDEVYLELHPAKVMVEDDDFDGVLEGLGADSLAALFVGVASATCTLMSLSHDYDCG